jgi:hypothetical protein
VKSKNQYVIFYRLYESWNGLMGMGKESVVVKYVGEGVIVDSERKIYR